MKVLQISKFYPPDCGGIEAVARNLTTGLLKQGVQVEVLCANKAWRELDDRDATGVRVIRAASMGLLLSTSMAPGMIRLLRHRCQDADVVHVHMPDPMAALAVWMARPDVPVVLHWHSDVVRQRVARHLYNPLQSWLLRRADAVVATSRAYADSSVPLRPWLHKVRVVHSGAPPPEPPTNPETVATVRARFGNRRIIFALGRMAHYKGYDVLIEAARHLPPDVVVVVGGGGDRLAYFRARVDEARLTDRVRFIGPLTAAGVEAHFAAAEVFCLASTSRAEAFGVVVLEAMARGLPVVATDIPGSGLGWLHQPGITGLTVPPHHPVALADGLTRMLADAEARAGFGRAGRERWAQHFSLGQMCDSMLALYRQLLAERYSLDASISHSSEQSSA